MAGITGKILFAIEGSLVDLIRQRIPNYSRGTGLLLHRVVDGGIQLYPVEAFTPAFFFENSAFYLERDGINLLTYNIDLTAPPWLLGSVNSIVVRRDLGDSPDGSFLADLVAFIGGDRSPSAAPLQTISRDLVLNAETDYTLTALLQLTGGEFARNSSNVIQVTGNVASCEPIYLADLNDFHGRYKLLTCRFKTAGRNPVEIKWQQGAETPSFTVVSIATNVVTLSLVGLEAVAGDALLGGQVRLIMAGQNHYDYMIIGNAASTGAQIVITLAIGSNPAGVGITTAATAFILKAPSQNCKLEIYSTSIAKMLWGGGFLEVGTHSTSPIYQEEEIFARDGVKLEYLNSPIERVENFGIFLDLWYWKGDGNLVDIENITIRIEDGALVVRAGSVTVTSPNLPKENVSIFVQISSSSSSLSLYINGTLVERVGIVGFAGNIDAKMIFTTNTGVRAFRRVIITDVLLDGQISVGQQVGQEVFELFNDPSVLPMRTLAAQSPMFLLPPVTIPAMTPPIAQALITGVTGGTNTISVTVATGFVAAAPVKIYRGVPGLSNSRVIASSQVVSISGTNIVLNSVASILLGDFIVYGDATPGKASIRYPFLALDPQDILVVDAANRWLTLSSVASFTKSRAFVQTPKYVDVAEVLVELVDPPNSRIKVDRVTGISVGDRISQPKLGKELIVSPECIDVRPIDPVNGVTAEKFSNGVVVTNNNFNAVVWRALASIYL